MISNMGNSVEVNALVEAVVSNIDTLSKSYGVYFSRLSDETSFSRENRLLYLA